MKVDTQKMSVASLSYYIFELSLVEREKFLGGLNDINIDRADINSGELLIFICYCFDSMLSKLDYEKVRGVRLSYYVAIWNGLNGNKNELEGFIKTLETKFEEYYNSFGDTEDGLFKIGFLASRYIHSGDIMLVTKCSLLYGGINKYFYEVFKMIFTEIELLSTEWMDVIHVAYSYAFRGLSSEIDKLIEDARKNSNDILIEELEDPMRFSQALSSK